MVTVRRGDGGAVCLHKSRHRSTSIRGTGGYGTSAIFSGAAQERLAHQMRAIFAASMTAVHLAISSVIRAFNLAGLEGRGSLPSARKRSITLGSASSPVSSEFKRSQDRIRQASRSHKTHPAAHIKCRESRLRNGRNVRQLTGPRSGGNSENAHFAASDVLQQDYRGIDHEVDAPAEQLCQSLRAATIGHVLKLNLCLLRQMFDQQMLNRSQPGCAVEQGRARGACRVDKVRYAAH